MTNGIEQQAILPFDSPKATLAVVGGKGANLAKLAQAGFPVPGGFLVTTAAYRAFVAANDLERVILEIARNVQADDPGALEAASSEIRNRFAAGTMLPDLAAAVRAQYAALGRPPVAVRSSATAEDLPDMSFAGQQDTYLNIMGDDALLDAIVRCWGSLWTARAIGYRARNGIPPEGVALAVVVQAMVQSEASGVLFTANPLNGKRMEVVIDATLGLGEALVSGQVDPDHYVVDAASGRILSKTLGSKALAIHGQAGGGTHTVEADASARQALPDAAIRELAQLGLRVAAFYGAPQDIEWAWAEGQLYLVQARPITSLFPLPANLEAEPLRLLVSFGSVQGMLDPMTPLGQDMIGLMAVNGGRRFLGYPYTLETQHAMYVAAERLFINVTPILRSTIGRRLLPRALSIIDPGARQWMDGLLDDPRLALEGGRPRLSTLRRVAGIVAPILGAVALNLLRPQARYVYLQRRIEAQIRQATARASAAKTLEERVHFLEDIPLFVFPTILRYVVPGVVSGLAPMGLLQRLAGELPGGGQIGLQMTRGLPHNVTSEMDLVLWATAQRIRADPDAAARFAQAPAAALAGDYLAGRLPKAAQEALASFLRRYGMRGVAEVDLGRSRWREDPTPIVQVLQSYLQIAKPDQAPDVQFRRGAADAEQAIRRLSHALRRTRGGRLKARLAATLGRRMRTFAGVRETPKFTIIRLMGLARAGFLQSGAELVRAGVLDQADDLFYLHVAELHALAAGEPRDWRGLVAERRQVYAREKARRQIPRLLLSDGQAFYEGLGASADASGAIVGSPVSPGVVEGVVHVVLDPHGAQLAPGEILVCPATDPGWTPLFLAAGGLVMEVGGLMTHGSVVAREYGIPAVVGVHEATTRLHTGQRIRVDGSTGQIVILETTAPEPSPALV